MYGLIGEKLGHSFSKEIHEKLAPYTYSLTELSPTEMDEFFRAKKFKAVNVTIPYKEKVLPYLDVIDPVAKEIGAVNTVVCRGGKLYGYNTDFYGLKNLFFHAGVDVKGKKVAVLGTGGTSKTATAVCKALGAREIIKVSRKKINGAVSYLNLYEKHADIQVLVNTTPVGMYPNTDSCPVEIDRFPALSGVIDVVYNPLKTELILQAEERKIPAESGLYMLVCQAVKASELFLGKEYPKDAAETIYREILRSKKNLVLVGMPSSGKTTLSTLLAKKLNRSAVDTDRTVVEKTGREIADIFACDGEEAFRALEEEAVQEAAKQTGVVIATGGGVVLKKKNVRNLKKNGKIYFLDRPLKLLTATADRPLTKDTEGMKKRYDERYEKYLAAADTVVKADKSLEEELNEILGDWER